MRLMSTACEETDRFPRASSGDHPLESSDWMLSTGYPVDTHRVDIIKPDSGESFIVPVCAGCLEIMTQVDRGTLRQRHNNKKYRLFSGSMRELNCSPKCATVWAAKRMLRLMVAALTKHQKYRPNIDYSFWLCSTVWNWPFCELQVLSFHLRV